MNLDSLLGKEKMVFNIIFADGTFGVANAHPDAFVAGTSHPTMHSVLVKRDPGHAVAQGWMKESDPKKAIEQLLGEKGIKAQVEEI